MVMVMDTLHLINAAMATQFMHGLVIVQSRQKVQKHPIFRLFLHGLHSTYLQWVLVMIFDVCIISYFEIFCTDCLELGRIIDIGTVVADE